MKPSRDSKKDAWSEDDSRLYREIASVAVPGREEQIATILTVLPFDRLEPVRIIELGSGPGTLSHALLDCFPNATLVALDGSESMRSHAKSRLAGFVARFQSSSFGLPQTDWYAHLDGTDVVVSSLCVHHLSGEEKRCLFSLVSSKSSARGSLVIADLIEPQFPRARELFASTWDREARERSRENPELFGRFTTEEWNHYRFPDPSDRPSSLMSQLDWLKEAGFAIVDCFWLQAGHAVFGGFKDASQGAGGVAFTEALRIAKQACRATR